MTQLVYKHDSGRGSKNLPAFDQETEIISGLRGEVSLSAFLGADIGAVFRDDLARIRHVVVKGVRDERNAGGGLSDPFSLGNRL